MWPRCSSTGPESGLTCIVMLGCWRFHGRGGSGFISFFRAGALCRPISVFTFEFCDQNRRVLSSLAGGNSAASILRAGMNADFYGPHCPLQLQNRRIKSPASSKFLCQCRQADAHHLCIGNTRARHSIGGRKPAPRSGELGVMAQAGLHQQGGMRQGAPTLPGSRTLAASKGNEHLALPLGKQTGQQDQ